MLGRVIVALIVIILVLLIAQHFSNDKPLQNNLSDDEYAKKLAEYECSYNSTRNTLLFALIAVLSLGLVRSLKSDNVSGGAEHEMFETIEEDEVDIFA